MDITKLNDGELDALQQQLDERARTRNLAKAPLRGYRVGRPAAPEPGARPIWSSRFDISAVSNRVKDCCGEISIASQKDDQREFGRTLDRLQNTIATEIARGFDEYWSGLDEDGHGVLLDAIFEVESTLDMLRGRLRSRVACVQAMLDGISKIELPKPPLLHRAGEAVADGLAHATELVASGAAKAGKVIAEGARAVKSLMF